jgi:DNA-directed RNA polymerase subunit H (RpoH/RPB5)
MSSSRKLISIERNEKKTFILILTNIVKMIYNRGLIKDYNKHLDDLLNKYNDDEKVFEINTDKDYKNILIKFVKGKLTTIRKIPNIDNFFVKGKNNKKIVVVKDINQKAYKQFMEYKDTEVFWEKNLKIDIIQADIVPKHELLTKEEEEEFYKTTGIKKKDMSKIYVTDAISRYYNAKVGNVFKITRMSITSGYGVHYRLVITSSLFN